MNSKNLRHVNGLPQIQAASMAALLVALMVALVAFSGSTRGPLGASARSFAKAPVIQSDQIFHFTPAQTAELQRLTDTPAKAKAFEANLQKGMAAFGLKMTNKAPTSVSGQSSLNVQAANYTGDATTEDVFSQGWDRDHWWLIMSYADIAYGGTAVATGACSAYLPWFVCVPIGGIIASWVRGWGSANNHGIWMGIYRSGWVTGGRW